jgi:HEAT repeat protein
MKNVLKWIAVVVSVSSLVTAQKQIFPFLLFLAATLVIIPPLRSNIERKVPIFKMRGMTGLAWALLFIFASALWSPIDPHIKHLEAQKNVDELIQIVQKQDGNADQAATALGNIGDKQAVALLIKTIEDASATSSLRENSIEALGKLQDAKAVQSLAKLLSNESTDTITKAKSALRAISESNRLAHRRIVVDLVDDNSETVQRAKQVLAIMGAPAVEDTLGILKEAEPKYKPVIMETLGEIGDPRAVKPLSEYLTDWAMKADAGKALEKLNWQPESDRERVRYWVALGRGAMLNEKWDMTKRVLMEDVKSSQRNLIDYALYSFITIGNKDVIPNLVDALHNQESKEMALAYLNCGEPTLEAAGTTWANDRGYEVIKKKDASKSKFSWGSMKN